MISIHTAWQKGLKAESVYKNIDVKEYIEIGQGKGLNLTAKVITEEGGHTKIQFLTFFLVLKRGGDSLTITCHLENQKEV